MKANKFLKEMVNLEYFEFPCSKIKSKLLSFKFHLSTVKITTKTSELFICNKTSPYDKFFISNCIESPFIFLKDSVLNELYNRNFTGELATKVQTDLMLLSKAFVSVVIFPERHQSVTGNFDNISNSFIDFIYDIGFNNVSFINLIGTYFIRPIWAPLDRVCDTKAEKKFTINTLNLSRDDFYEKFKKYTPSSASVYSKKIPIYLRGNKLAENFETFLYVCPNCNKLFSVFSEFSCLKCSNCGTAFEFTNSGNIDLCKHFSSIDDAAKFQFDLLSTIKPSYERFYYYDTLFVRDFYKDSKSTFIPCQKFDIFQDKIVFSLYDTDLTINYGQIVDIYLDYDNQMYFTWKEENDTYNKFVFKGTNKENLYIILDLIKLYNENIEFFSE